MAKKLVDQLFLMALESKQVVPASRQRWRRRAHVVDAGGGVNTGEEARGQVDIMEVLEAVAATDDKHCKRHGLRGNGRANG